MGDAFSPGYTLRAVSILTQPIRVTIPIAGANTGDNSMGMSYAQPQPYG